MATTPISTLAIQALNRVEENPTDSVFWNLTTEAYTAVMEAINDLLLLIGRPTQIVQQALTIQPNTPWQSMPAGMLCLTDIQGPSSQVYKYTLYDLDYMQVSWGSDWENDVDDQIKQWFPIGFNMFGVHPAVSMPQTVTVTGVALATTNSWPYTGSELVPFHDEMFQAFEKYAAHYLRFKEGGDEFSASYALFKEYLADAQRLTQLEDRRDPYIWARNIGVQTGINPTSQR